MNPWGLMVIGIGIFAVWIGLKGSQGTVKAAITGNATDIGQQISGNSAAEGSGGLLVPNTSIKQHRLGGP